MRPDVVTQLLKCLTPFLPTCWDLFDPNTAGPCMQKIIDDQNSTDITSIQIKIKAIGGFSHDVLGFGAMTAMLPDSQRSALAACVAQVSTVKSALACIACTTSVDEAKCK